jgi:hypothetical protein
MSTTLSRSARVACAVRALGGAAWVSVAAAGCAGEVTGVAGGSGVAVTVGSGASPVTALDPALLGRWRRAVVFSGADGSVNSSETTWTFAGDGSALRTVVARNVTSGYADAVSASASWRTEGGTVVITYRPPDFGTARFAYSLDRTGGRDVLYLGSQAYARVGL